MTFRKHVMITLVLVAVSGLLFGCSGSSTTGPAATNETPILGPANVTATTLSNGDVRISWDANTQTNLRGYNVYRNDITSGEIGRINTNEITITSYVDSGAEWRHSYEYTVTSVSTKGSESTAVGVNYDHITTPEHPEDDTGTYPDRDKE